MNRSQFVTKVAETAGFDKKTAEAAVNAVIATLTEAFAAEEKVQFVGFGTFEVKKREARTGRNPSTGESMEIPASVTPVFKASKTLIKK